MNIQQEALHHFLQNKDIKHQYFYSEDFTLICEKSLIYQKKNQAMPSVNFLLEFSNKLSDKPEQVDSIEDLLYTQSKFKPELDDVNEVNELLLEFYKKEKIKEFTLGLGKALKEGNDGKVQRLSEQITEVSKLNLSGEDFRENDIKKDLEESNTKMELIPSGFLPTAHESISKIARGSVISIVAATSEGKSVLAINGVTQQYLNGFNTIYVSYELPKSTVLARMLSSISEVPISEISSEIYSTEEAEIRVKAGKAVLKYDISFDKAFSRVLKGKDFEDCKIRENYLKVIAVASAGDISGIHELPNSEALLNMIEEYSPDFLTVDLLSEVQISNSAGSYETDLSNLVRDFKRKALKHSSVVVLINQPSGETIYGLINAKYAKSIRSSADSNLLISSTSDMKKESISVVIAEKVRHSQRGVCCPVLTEFQYMKFTHMENEPDLKMEDYFAELSKSLKKGEK